MKKEKKYKLFSFSLLIICFVLFCFSFCFIIISLQSRYCLWYESMSFENRPDIYLGQVKIFCHLSPIGVFLVVF